MSSVARSGQCSLNDGVRTSGRIASMCISVTMACAMVALVQDEWIKLESSDGFASWTDLKGNGTVDSIEFGLHGYCIRFKPENSFSSLPDGLTCYDYGDYISSYFTEVKQTEHCDQFTKANVCFYAHKIGITLLCTFIIAFMGALYSEKPSATIVSGLLCLTGMASASIMSLLIDNALRSESGGSSQFLTSRAVSVAGTCFALFTFILGVAACYFKPDNASSGFAPDGEGGNRGYSLFNDNIEMIGRIGSAFGQLAWLLYLVGALSDTWYEYDNFGNPSLAPYRFENTTFGEIGLLGFCVQGQDSSETDGLYGAYLSKPFVCYSHRGKFGPADTRGCDIFGICDELNICMGILFCGILVGALADFFSEKMMIQFGLQLVAMLCGVAVLSITARPLGNPSNVDASGTIARGGYFLVSGVVLFCVGSVFCFIDGLDVCRVKPGDTPTCCQQMCSCSCGGGGGSYDVSDGSYGNSVVVINRDY